MERIVVPPPNLSRIMELRLGRCRWLKTLRDKEPFSRHGGIQKERVIVPWAGRRHWVIGFSGSDAPVDGLPRFIFFPKPISRRAQSGLLLGVVHRFWTILGGILAGFIVLKQLVQGFDSWHSVQAELLEVPSKRIHEPALVAVELRESPGILSHPLVVGYDAVYSPIENHQPCGIAGDDLREYPCGSAYLILSAFVGDEAIEYLLPDALIRRSQGTGILSFFDGGEAVPECILITWRSASAFDSAFACNACHSYPEPYRMIFVHSIREIFVCSVRKTFGHLSDRAKKTMRITVLTSEHYIRNKAFVSLIGSTRFPSAPTKCIQVDQPRHASLS